jgi:hypothetical protein
LELELQFSMVFATCSHVHLPFCRVCAIFVVLQPVILLRIYLGLVLGCMRLGLRPT